MDHHMRVVCDWKVKSYSKGNTMASGTVKWFNSQKGYGFIQPADGGQDVFVHISAVERAGLNGLNEGQKLSYEVVADRRTGKSSADKLQVTN
jgi:cold shock protein